MKIVFLCWGSLIWSPGILKKRGKWHRNGPLLPIEFARISKDGRLTLVLHTGAKKSRVLWARAYFSDLDKAIENLRDREGTTKERIGYLSVQSGKSRCRTAPRVLRVIKNWAGQKDIQAVVWTDLRSNFEKKLGKQFSLKNSIEYLLELKDNHLGNYNDAEDYIRNTPTQVQTRNRPGLEKFIAENND